MDSRKQLDNHKIVITKRERSLLLDYFYDEKTQKYIPKVREQIMFKKKKVIIEHFFDKEKKKTQYVIVDMQNNQLSPAVSCIDYVGKGIFQFSDGLNVNGSLHSIHFFVDIETMLPSGFCVTDLDPGTIYSMNFTSSTEFINHYSLFENNIVEEIQKAREPKYQKTIDVIRELALLRKK